jgi:hypothetical protein
MWGANASPTKTLNVIITWESDHMSLYISATLGPWRLFRALCHLPKSPILNLISTAMPCIKYQGNNSA